MNTFYLLLDIGSTSIKCALTQSGNTRLSQIKSSPTPHFLTTSSDIKEIEPIVLLATCKKLIENYLKSGLVFDGLLITGQMGCWVLTDLENSPLTNLVSWQDSRGFIGGVGGPNSYNFLNKEISHELRKSNGNEFRMGLPLVGLHQHLKDTPVQGSGIRIHSLISWVGSQLSEDYKFIAHSTDAAASGFFDIWHQSWSQIALAHFPRDLYFPEVTNDIVEIGTNPELSCPVFTPIGDQQSSLLGIGIRENQIAVNIGTGGQIAKVVDKLTSGEVQQRPYFKETFIITKTHLPAGRSIAAFLSFIMGKVPQGNDFIWMNSQSVSPHQLKKIEVKDFQTEIMNLSNSKNYSKAELAANVIESLARSYALEIKKISNDNDSELLMAGGIGKRMTKIGEILGKELDMQVIFTDTEETTLQGLANSINFLNFH